MIARADFFRSLHHGPDILVLPNAWDCASARIFELAGFPAIATTSAGIAFSLGYPDRERIPMADMLTVVRRIAACVKVPVTADLEGGYGDIEATAAALVESGAVGLNLEDVVGGTLLDIEHQCRKIETVRATGAVVNARCDLYLDSLRDPGTRFERTIERLRAYIAAGADCVFVPGITDDGLIGRFTAALRFPLNVIAVAGTPPVGRLRELGVARVSVGSGIARSAVGHTRRVAETLRREGTFESMIEGSVPYAEMNRLFGG